MFDILVFLFQEYFQVEGYPEPEQLARELSAAGFEPEDISEALDWLSPLQPGEENLPQIDPASRSIRIFDAEEQGKLGRDCRSFLAYLENAGMLDAYAREVAIERAMALPQAVVSLGRFKVIILMVLWTRQQALDPALLDELLTGLDPRHAH